MSADLTDILQSTGYCEVYYSNIFIVILLFKHFFSAAANPPIYFSHENPPQIRLFDKHSRTKVNRTEAFFSPAIPEAHFSNIPTPPVQITFLGFGPDLQFGRPCNLRVCLLHDLSQESREKY